MCANFRQPGASERWQALAPSITQENELDVQHLGMSHGWLQTQHQLSWCPQSSQLGRLAFPGIIAQARSAARPNAQGSLDTAAVQAAQSEAGRAGLPALSQVTLGYNRARVQEACSQLLAAANAYKGILAQLPGIRMGSATRQAASSAASSLTAAGMPSRWLGPCNDACVPCLAQP